MKLTDALVETLLENGMSHAFGLTGGAVVHIFDSMEQKGFGVTYMHHEQSAALAAVAHAKVTENVGCAVVTTGPGATNAVTGITAAWQDSIPCLFLTGQVRSQHTSYGRKVRQVGTQEINICDIARPITKYCKFVKSPESFLSDLDEALKVAQEGRPGPVLLDIPLDFQWADIEYPVSHLATNKSGRTAQSGVAEVEKFDDSLKMLLSAQRPLLVLGYGVRLASCIESLRNLIDLNHIPFVTTWTAADIFPTDHACNLGIIGMSGQAGANAAAFSADLLVCLGTHLSIPHTTTLYDSYAPQAKKVIINIDEDQLKNLNVEFDLTVRSDLGVYVDWLTQRLNHKFAWEGSNSFKSPESPESIARGEAEL